MKATTVEIVFVIDASESMRPCIEGLIHNLTHLTHPLQAFQFKLRLGLLAMNVGRFDGNGRMFRVTTLDGDADSIYAQSRHLFTDDTTAFSTALHNIVLGGDEHHLIALDLALDFPFDPDPTTRRVIALFSDECIEDGMVMEKETSKIPELVTKIMARRILFFAALPSSPLLEDLAVADGCQIEPIQGGNGLATVKMDKLLAQMAKSISMSTLQRSEENYTRALYNQNLWQPVRNGTFDGLH